MIKITLNASLFARYVANHPDVKAILLKEAADGVLS